MDVLKEHPLKHRAVLEGLRVAFTTLFENVEVDTTYTETIDYDEWGNVYPGLGRIAVKVWVVGAYPFIIAHSL